MNQYSAQQIDYKSEQFTEETFNAFYDDYYKRIYNFLYFRIGDSFAAEDLTGVILEKVLKNMYRYDETQTQLNTWIFTIVRNTLIDFFRLKRRGDVYFEEGAELALPDTVSPGVEAGLLEKERNRQIASAMAALPDRDREVLALKFWGGLRSKEIAAEIGLDAATVNVIVFRALKKLKKYMEAQGMEF